MRMVMMAVGAVIISATVALAEGGGCPFSRSACGKKAGGEQAAAGSVCDKSVAKEKAGCPKGMPLYACAMCRTVAKEAGQCGKCGMDMAAMHVLICKDGEAKLCACAADCACTLKEDDPTKCSCGKDVVTVSVTDLPGCGGCKRSKPAAKES